MGTRHTGSAVLCNGYHKVKALQRQNLKAVLLPLIFSKPSFEAIYLYLTLLLNASLICSSVFRTLFMPIKGVKIKLTAIRRETLTQEIGPENEERRVS